MSGDERARRAEESARRAVVAIWRIESARIVATLTRYTRDFSLAEDLAEVHGLLALLELTAARFPARVDAHGEPVLLADQDRRRWDRGAIRRGTAALARVERFGRGFGPYALQAVIAEAHAKATDVESTDWARIVAAYEGLEQIAPSPVVTLNRAVAVSMAEGPDAGSAAALAIVDALGDEQALATGHLLPSVRGALLARLGRDDEARQSFALAAERAQNARERAVLLAKAVADR